MKRKKRDGRANNGRLPTGLTESKVLVTGPALLMAAVEHRAKQQGLSVREAWRRAARDWLDRLY